MKIDKWIGTSLEQYARTELARQQYHEDHEHLSNSMLTVLHRNPKEFEARFVTKTWEREKTSEAMTFGSLVHTLVLEPWMSEIRYHFYDKPDLRYKVGKEVHEQALSIASEYGKELIPTELRDRAVVCASGLTALESWRLLVECSSKDIETPIYWTINGINFRCMPDIVLPERKLVIDVKTTQDPAPAKFARSAFDYGYHRQAALYCRAAEHKYGDKFGFVFAAVRSSPPYDAAIHFLDEQCLDIANNEIDLLIEDYTARSESGDWSPAYSNEVNVISPPSFYQPFTR